MKKYILLMSVCILCSCNATPIYLGESFNKGNLKDSNNALVYLFRSRKSNGLYPMFYVNDKPLTGMITGSYLPIELPPGVYTFETRNSLNSEPSKKEIRLEAGEKYYLRWMRTKIDTDYGYAVGMVFVSSHVKYEFLLLNENEALPLLKNCRIIILNPTDEDMIRTEKEDNYDVGNI